VYFLLTTVLPTGNLWKSQQPYISPVEKMCEW